MSKHNHGVTNSFFEVLNAALAHADTLPTKQRAELYLHVARSCGSETEARQIMKCADDLLAADSLCREFNFSFSQHANSFFQK